MIYDIEVPSEITAPSDIELVHDNPKAAGQCLQELQILFPQCKFRRALAFDGAFLLLRFPCGANAHKRLAGRQTWGFWSRFEPRLRICGAQLALPPPLASPLPFSSPIPLMAPRALKLYGKNN